MNKTVINGNNVHTLNSDYKVISSYDLSKITKSTKTIIDRSNKTPEEYRSVLKDLSDVAFRVDQSAVCATQEFNTVIEKLLDFGQIRAFNTKGVCEVNLSSLVNRMVSYLIYEGHRCIVYLDEDNEECIVVPMEEYDSIVRRKIYKAHSDLIQEADDDFYFDISVVENETWEAMNIKDDRIIFNSTKGEW